jgi:hypothetical protein
MSAKHSLHRRPVVTGRQRAASCQKTISVWSLSLASRDDRREWRAGIHLRIPRHGGENDPARNRETTALLCGMTSIPTKIRIVTLLQRRENESSDAAPSGPHRPQTHCVPGFWC